LIRIKTRYNHNLTVIILPVRAGLRPVQSFHDKTTSGTLQKIKRHQKSAHQHYTIQRKPAQIRICLHGHAEAPVQVGAQQDFLQRKGDQGAEGNTHQSEGRPQQQARADVDRQLDERNVQHFFVGLQAHQDRAGKHQPADENE